MQRLCQKFSIYEVYDQFLLPFVDCILLSLNLKVVYSWNYLDTQGRQNIRNTSGYDAAQNYD